MIWILTWWMKHHFSTWLQLLSSPYQELIASSLVFADCWGSSYGTDGGAPRVFYVFCWVSGFALNFWILIQSLFRWDEFMNWMDRIWTYCVWVKGAQQFNVFSRFTTNFMIFVIFVATVASTFVQGLILLLTWTAQNLTELPPDLSLPGAAGSLFLLAAFPCCAPRQDQPHDRGRDPRAQVSHRCHPGSTENPTGTVVSSTQES